MRFQEVARFFSQIEQESSRLKKTELIATLLKKTTPTEAAIISYLSLGSLQPVYRREQFNFAEKNVIKVIARMLSLNVSVVKKIKVKLGDLGDVVEKHYSTGEISDLEIKEVSRRLFGFLAITGIGSQDRKERALYELLQELDALSAKYVVRVILGKLRLGFSDMTLLDAFSWVIHGNKSIRKQLERAYNVSADIGLIIKTLKEKGLAGIDKISITPGIPIRPAAAERLPDAAAIIGKIGPCVAQIKLDGFRLQVHIDNTGDRPHVDFFSRNLLNMSEMFPDLRKAVGLLKVKTLVAEGEAIAYDETVGTFLPFQDTVKRRRKYDIEEMAEELPLHLYFFDIIYMDGKTYLNEPHHKRRQVMLKLLDTAIVKKQGVLFPIEEKRIETVQDLESYFSSTVEVGLEGVVVKRDDAPYQPGKRNYNWIKLKRQETGELDDTIDCVILGYYFGKGKRAGLGIGAFLVGVYNEAEGLFQTVAKIGTGLKDDEWRQLKELIDQCSVSHKPDDVVCRKELTPDVWAIPEKVCMVRADEITKSPLHSAGVVDKKHGLALRFPRFMGYRNDKSATDATTVVELQKLYAMQFNKKSHRNKKQSKKSKKEINLKIS